MDHEAEFRAVLKDLTTRPDEPLLELGRIWEEPDPSFPEGKWMVSLIDAGGQLREFQWSNDPPAVKMQYLFGLFCQDAVQMLTTDPLPKCPLHYQMMSLDGRGPVARWTCMDHPEMTCVVGRYWEWREELGEL